MNLPVHFHLILDKAGVFIKIATAGCCGCTHTRRNPYLVGSFSPDFHSGDIFTSESDQEPGKFIFPLSYPLGELLMTNLLGTGYGVMLHSCGVIDAGNGIVFAGVSAAGKTTTARLWDGQAGRACSE